MTRMIITPACTNKYQAPYIDITESYDKIKNLFISTSAIFYSVGKKYFSYMYDSYI